MIAIIGLGGTGAYILDFIVKTPVREISGFDKDRYFVHNAFRSPGRLDESEIGKTKAEIYHARYDNFRTGLTIAEKFVDATCEEDFKGVTFAFVCVDKGSSHAGIFDLLMKLGIPFIDVGMGLNRKQGMGMAQIPKTPKAIESPGTQPLRLFWRLQAATSFCCVAAVAFVSYSSRDGATIIAFFA